MRIWKCDRCQKIYEKNKNDILEKINKPILKSIDDWSATYIKMFNSRLDIETILFNLCDECFEELYKWFKRED